MRPDPVRRLLRTTGPITKYPFKAGTTLLTFSHTEIIDSTRASCDGAENRQHRSDLLFILHRANRDKEFSSIIHSFFFLLETKWTKLLKALYEDNTQRNISFPFEINLLFHCSVFKDMSGEILCL